MTILSIISIPQLHITSPWLYGMTKYYYTTTILGGLQRKSRDFTRFHELLVEAAPGLLALLQVLLHDLDVGEGTVAFRESGRAPAPAVVVAAEQLALGVARHVAECCLHETPTQELWQDILQAWEQKNSTLINRNTWLGFLFWYGTFIYWFFNFLSEA